MQKYVVIETYIDDNNDTIIETVHGPYIRGDENQVLDSIDEYMEDVKDRYPDTNFQIKVLEKVKV